MGFVKNVIVTKLSTAEKDWSVAHGADEEQSAPGHAYASAENVPVACNVRMAAYASVGLVAGSRLAQFVVEALAVATLGFFASEGDVLALRERTSAAERAVVNAIQDCLAWVDDAARPTVCAVSRSAAPVLTRTNASLVYPACRSHLAVTGANVLSSQRGVHVGQSPARVVRMACCVGNDKALGLFARGLVRVHVTIVQPIHARMGWHALPGVTDKYVLYVPQWGWIVRKAA